jgi:hypothetical protein
MGVSWRAASQFDLEGLFSLDMVILVNTYCCYVSFGSADIAVT